MSYVITIKRPAGKPSLTTQDYEWLLENDGALSKTSEGTLIWTPPHIQQEFYITLESNHIWTDNIASDESGAFVEKLREIAVQLDARVYDEEGDDITEIDRIPMSTKEKLVSTIGILVTIVSIPFIIILLLIQLPWIIWKMWIAIK
jgi:hypothetical protein